MEDDQEFKDILHQIDYDSIMQTKVYEITKKGRNLIDESRKRA